MNTPSFKEDHISQIPALQMLINLGYTYIAPTESDRQRGGKHTNVLLDDILRSQLRIINANKHISSSRTTYISDTNIENGIRALRELPMQEGYVIASEALYNLITLGKSFDQQVDGEKKSFTLQYIDWQNLENNVFHVTEEFSVTRTNGKDQYRPDIVLFVNGIPMCVIECKRPDMKEPIKQAISQHLRNQQEDGIKNLYVFAQIVLSIATQEGSYATLGTIEKFWAQWKEKFNGNTLAERKSEEDIYRSSLQTLKNKPLPIETKDKLFSERFRYVRQYFDAIEAEPILPTAQDEYLYGLCSPERLLDLVFGFTLYDNGVKKVARYQQYFAIKKSIHRINETIDGRRKGGVIWHTQGSGKSLTMVMLAQAIATEPSIRNPKIILVTDRTDLDDQITGTFRKCGKFVENATTGQRLAELLSSNTDAVVTTIINKFVAAMKKIKEPFLSKDIFVLIDEGHRTQHGTFNVEMEKALPHACFIAMTGTPLFKKDKSTATKFGGVIDAYTVDQAVKDKAVVPLLYEGRLSRQSVNDNPMDTFFEMISEPFNEYQKADFKKKFSRADQLNAAEQKMKMIAYDISHHFADNWKGTPFKGQLVCDKKINAVRYKSYLDEFGLVSSEVLISSPDDREGEDTAYAASSEPEKIFWKRMMNEHGNPKKYETNIINRFKNQKDPEIIIVVDKLLTGFDESKNTVLYLTRNLQGHKLLQAIARVNRIHDDKEFGYIIDYYGVIKNLDTALELYSSFEDFDEEDLEGTMIDINEEIKKLPQKHSELWDIFKTISNKRDAEAYQVLLKDEAIRVMFYDKLSAYAKALKLALSALQFHKNTEPKTIDRYKEDLAMFMKLRLAVIARYSDTIDYKQYEGQIQKLIDTHINSEKVEIITEMVNIFDKEKFQEEVESTTGKAAKADKIASRTAKHISEKMDEDPAFYKKFSQMLRETIADYEAERLSDAQYLTRVKEIMDNVLSHTDSDIPEILKDKDVAKAFYGITLEAMKEKIFDEKLNTDISAEVAIHIDEIIRNAVLDMDKPIIDWQNKSNITGKLLIDIGDYLIDEVRDKYKVSSLTFGDMDAIADKCISVAKLRYKG
ncbi:MAG TPA: HsdR family type I site-specific deoxyribonuclease [Saprospiraceae bacterium]|nr:type I restriction endonuclease subunit R [Saprospiraceae bacterium]MBK8825875.1 type I restriction endonuclease subunit R [Saprospiraceae bacterium]MBK9582004.1 type I restriction endonuclease subunit R [Saprospiraceae bacterium]HRG41563.1 HsdR family type I site-specific deoxyribonuclease [Saprospiraceae bacterium]